MHTLVLVLVAAAWTSPLSAQPTPAWHTRLRMRSAGCRPVILRSAGEPHVPVPPKDIDIHRDEPHAGLRPRWFIPWLKVAKAWPKALDIWSSAWAGIFLVGSLCKLAGKPVKLFDGIKSMQAITSHVFYLTFGDLSIGEALKQEFPMRFLVPVSLLMGVNVFLTFKSKGMKGVIKPAWIWKRTKQFGSGVIGTLGLVTLVHSWLPAKQYTSYLHCLMHLIFLIYSLPHFIDVFYFARWAFKTDEGKDYGLQWKEYRRQVQDYRRAK